MKLTSLFALLCCGLLFVACDYESLEDETSLAELETGNAFVRFLGDFSGMEEVVVSEDNTTTSVTVESRVVDGNETTVNYNLGGTAEYGTIYTIEGASAAGGSIAIPFQEGDNTAPANLDINIMFLVDTLITPGQTIELTLASASAGGNAVDVGQGDLRREFTITLVND